ncbi:MAG: hypothetical protein ACOX63_02365 [Christensenellales bacterium]|jgi:putative aldouronate transport system substrate-binding protein
MARKLTSLALILILLFSTNLAMANNVMGNKVQSTEENELMFWAEWYDRVATLPPNFRDVEEAEGIKMTFIPRPEDEKEFLTLKIVSGEIPDIIRDFGFVTYDSFYQQGVYAEVPVELIKENAPLLVEWAEKNGGENIWKYYERDGKNYSVPIMWTLAKDNRVLGIREDLFQAAGAKIPTTIEEMGESLQLIRDKLNIYPLTATSLQSGLDWVFGAYGAFLNFHTGDDGAIEYGYIEDGAKTALQVLADWYARDLIDPEFYVNTDDNMQDKWDSGQAAICEHEWYFFMPQPAFYLGKFWESAMAQNPEAIITIIDAPTGDGTNRGFSLGNVVVSSGLQFGSHLSEEKIARYLRFFDKYSFTHEGYAKLMWGDEGVTYTYDEENGVQWLDGYKTKEERDAYGIGITSLPGCFNDYDLQAPFMTAPQYLEMRKEGPTHSSGKIDVLQPVYRPIYNEKIEALNMFIRQAFIDIIIGDRPVDDFESIRDEWLSMGGQEVMDEAIAVYEELVK